MKKLFNVVRLYCFRRECALHLELALLRREVAL